MSITALVCKVVLGVGALNVVPGFIQSPRYADTEVVIQFADDVPRDVVVTGPLDLGVRYSAAGMKLSALPLAGGWLIEVVYPGDSPERETLLIDNGGGLLWTQLGYAAEMHAASASLYRGTCEAI